MSRSRFEVPNHRGRPVPRLLGVGIVPAALVSTAAALAAGRSTPAGWSALGGCLLVFAAGLVDDLSPIGPRGLRAHLRALASGHMTTGILKLVVTVASAVVVTASLRRGGGWGAASAAVLIAGCTNVWNGLDVRPGRAIKWYLVVVGIVLALRTRVDVPASAGLWLAGWIALPFDLRERAMLGDAGANLFGFAAGVQLASSLPAWALGPAALLAIALNVVADTFTFSRGIEAVPPLRWFDRLGRIPD